MDTKRLRLNGLHLLMSHFLQVARILLVYWKKKQIKKKQTEISCLVFTHSGAISQKKHRKSIGSYNPYTVICHIVTTFNSRFVCLIMHSKVWYSQLIKIYSKATTESGPKKTVGVYRSKEKERERKTFDDQNAVRHVEHNNKYMKIIEQKAKR